MMRPYQRLLCFNTWLNDFAGFLLIFAVGRLLAEQGAGLMKMGLVGGGFSLVMALASIVFGHVSDRVSQRWMITLASLLLAAAPIGYLITDNEMVRLCGWYWLSAAAGGMLYPPVYAWLSAGDGGGSGNGARSAKPQAARRITHTIIWFCMAWNLGIISGNLFGGWQFDRFGAEAPIYWAAVLALLNVPLWQLAARWRRLEALAAPVVAELTDNTPNPDAGREQRLSAGFVKLAWLANLGGAFSMSVVLHLFPALAVELRIPSDRHGSIIGLTRALVIVTYRVMWRSTFWHQRFGAALASQLIGVAGMLCLARAQGTAALIFGLTLLAQLVGFNYFASLYYSTHGSNLSRRGGAMGLYEATLGLGFAAGSALGGVLAERLHQGRLPYYLGAGVIFLFALAQSALYWSHVRPLRRGLASQD